MRARRLDELRELVASADFTAAIDPAYRAGERRFAPADLRKNRAQGLRADGDAAVKALDAARAGRRGRVLPLAGGHRSP